MNSVRTLPSQIGLTLVTAIGLVVYSATVCAQSPPLPRPPVPLPQPQPNEGHPPFEFPRANGREKIEDRFKDVRGDHERFLRQVRGYSEQLNSVRDKVVSLRKQRAEALQAVAAEIREARLAGSPPTHDIVEAYAAAHQAELDTLITKQERTSARERHIKTLLEFEKEAAEPSNADDSHFTKIDLYKAKAERFATEIAALRQRIPDTDPVELSIAKKRIGNLFDPFARYFGMSESGVIPREPMLRAGASYYRARAEVRISAGDDKVAFDDLLKSYEYANQLVEARKSYKEAFPGSSPESLSDAEVQQFEIRQKLSQLRQKMGMYPSAIPGEAGILVEPSKLEPAGEAIEATPSKSESDGRVIEGDEN